jgi:hypothetical protein
MKRISLAVGAVALAVSLAPSTGPASYAAAQDGTGRATLSPSACTPDDDEGAGRARPLQHSRRSS